MPFFSSNLIAVDQPFICPICGKALCEKGQIISEKVDQGSLEDNPQGLRVNGY